MTDDQNISRRELLRGRLLRGFPERAGEAKARTALDRMIATG